MACCGHLFLLVPQVATRVAARAFPSLDPTRPPCSNTVDLVVRAFACASLVHCFLAVSFEQVVVRDLCGLCVNYFKVR